MGLGILSQMRRTYAFPTVLYEVGPFLVALKFLPEESDLDLWKITLIRGQDSLPPEMPKRKDLKFWSGTLGRVKDFAERELLLSFPEILEYLEPPSALERILREP